MAMAECASPGSSVVGSPEEAGFQSWWENHGQFCRAGGGQYEKTFAYRAWMARSNVSSGLPAGMPENHETTDKDALIESLQQQLNEADRRAGASERLRAYDAKELDSLRAARRKMKAEAGFDDNVSFDVVWAKALAAFLQSQKGA